MVFLFVNIGRRVPIISTITRNSYLPTDERYAVLLNTQDVISCIIIFMQGEVGKFATIYSNIK